MVRAKLYKILSLALSAAAIFGCTNAYAIPVPDCLSAGDASEIKQKFFASFPDKIAFNNYADPSRFELQTNVVDGVALQRGGRTAAEKIDWLMSVFGDHKVLFENMTGFDHPIFSYIKGQLKGMEPSVDNGRTSTHFPKNECVLDVEFRAVGARCVMSQQLQNMALIFIKRKNRTMLTTVEIFFIACQENRPK